jgi:RHS repeat-associated protein
MKNRKITSLMIGILHMVLLAFATDVYGQTADTVLETAIITAKTVRGTHSITLNPGFSADGANGAITFEIAGLPVQNCVPLAATPSADQNYVLTLTPRQPFTDAASLYSKSTCEVMQTIQYIDGLGRPIQTVQVKANPDATKDVIMPVAYDAFGREAAKYLPYTTGTGIAGSYRSGAVAGQSAFYTVPPVGVSRIDSAFSATGFEASPLNRPLAQGAPGLPWQLGAHAVKIDYTANDATAFTGAGFPAKQYGVAINTGIYSLVDNGTYAAGQLYVTIIKDENWTSGKNHTSEEYKDKEGHVVLKRAFNGSEILSTYYVYDDYSNLCYVLPPKAEADGGGINQSVLTSLCYQYRYDQRQRLTQRRIPGQGWQYMVYNKLDQVVATQDSNQRINNQWIITKYDALGRAVITGIWNSSMSRTTLTDSVYAQTVQWEHKDTTQTNSYTVNSTFPRSLNTILSVSYFDNYKIPDLPAQYRHESENSSQTRSLATASKVNMLGTSDMLWTVNYYDNKGRVSNTYAQHYLGGTAKLNANNYDHISNSYDFTNAIVNTNRQHYTDNSGTPSLALTVRDSLVYDHMGRKRQTWSAINSPTPVLLAQTDYNEVGQALNKHLHSENNGATYLQGISYAYNERGWMVKDSSSKFSLNLKYNLPSSGITAQYNGNIAQMLYNGDHSGSKAFAYGYDALNRLTDAISTGSALNEALAYDKMGNITALTRGGASAATLAYTYATNSNLLTTVTNSGSAFRSYAYDGNGNATSDGGSQTINYNMLNLPQSVIQGGATKATYTYEANGNKIRNTGTDGTWDYVSGIVYKDNAISFVQTEEGRAVPNGGIYSYEYNLKDHLGNTRVSIDRGTDGTARVIQESEYYSFGLQHDLLHNDNRYLYNGKEIQTDLANQYDYGARFYDPVIGRWTTADPLANIFQHWSPYNYGANNPITFTDPTGAAIDNNVSPRNSTRYVDPSGRTIVNTEDGRNGIYMVPWNMYKTFANSVNNAGGFNSAGTYIDTKEWNDFWRKSLPRVASDYAMDHFAIGFEQLDNENKTKWVRALITDSQADRMDFEWSYIKSQWSDPVVVVTSLLAFAHAYVGTIPLTTEEIMENSNVLRGRTPESVQNEVGNTTNWQVEKLGKGSKKGQGWVLREYNNRGQSTGRVIRWHPGGGHHGPKPYWKVSNGSSVSGEIR